MSLELISKRNVIDLIARVGGVSNTFQVEVSEDVCFGEKEWINIGAMTLYPGDVGPDTDAYFDISCAVQLGGFEWRIPTLDELNMNLVEVLDRITLLGRGGNNRLNVLQRANIQKIFIQGLQDTMRRSLLLWPSFDMESIPTMPPRRPITIVPDTSAVSQGALDFVARFFAPWARIKVPAIVHMEIINSADNYFKARRGSRGGHGYRVAALKEHILSQGSQRTLLRLEFQPDMEIDRGDLGADPLRGIVVQTSDPEDKALGLQEIVRSFADRLIVETARRFANQVRPDHPLALLTSDQGMARMALAEGMGVLFFQARSSPIPWGRTLTGSLYHPFDRNELFTLSLADLLWELAVSFGLLRIRNERTGAALTLWGIGGSDEVTWQPSHVKDDLLWSESIAEQPGAGDNTVPASPSEVVP
jgi:hypothetical protein